ncbi:MAG: hypothetical protein EA398_04205 [Deltaproteobacteria bacterium]|nr:MAG: hypothetical protein EA398_04205 [Deltaproteobacteria bacterium]
MAETVPGEASGAPVAPEDASRSDGRGRRLWVRVLLAVGQALLIGLCLLLGGMAAQCGFEEVRDMRRLERVPQSATGAPLPGEINITGTALAGPAGLLQSPDTGTACIGYRYHVEREERDSEGNTRWVTVRDERRMNPFLVDDGSGAIRVSEPLRADLRWRSSHRRRSGNMRYTEYRLHPGDEAFVFGWAEVPSTLDRAATIRFDAEGQYRPIISRLGEQEARESMALSSVLLSWLGTTLLSLAVFFLFGLFRWHDTRAYVVLVSIVLGSALLAQGYAMVRDDLVDAAHRAERLREAAAAMWLAQGLAGEATLEREGVDRLPASTAFHLSRARIDVARAVERSLEQRGRFPERLVARMASVPPLQPLALDGDERARAEELDAAWEPARLRSVWAVIFLVVGLVGAFLFGLFGIRRVRVKRLIENLPTTPAAGVSFGLVEIGGSAAPCTSATGEVPGGGEGGHTFNGPVSRLPCLWYHYVVQEKRGSGKNSSWVTIHDERTWAPFESIDSSGRIRIYPLGCEYYTSHTCRSGGGRRTYTERAIRPGDALYVLGTAEIDETSGDRLCIVRGDETDPYIVSNLSEREVMIRKARVAQFLLNLGINAFVLAALLGFGIAGSFAATDYLMAALVGPVYLAILHVVLMYNDLVFLRQRVERNRANIDVALKKRHDLVQSVLPVVRGFAAHEASLLERVAELRTASRVEEEASRTRVQALGPQLRALREAYPSLGSDGLFRELEELLTALENDIALTRSGLNDAVERYNSRREAFPEVVLARTFGFARMPLLEFEAAIVEVPRATRTRALTGIIPVAVPAGATSIPVAEPVVSAPPGVVSGGEPAAVGASAGSDGSRASRPEIVAPPRPRRAVSGGESSATPGSSALAVEVQRPDGQWRAAEIVRGPDAGGRFQVRYADGAEAWVEGRQLRMAARG